MKRYKFRLESVLRVRRIQEDQARAEFIRANAQVAEAEKVVDLRKQSYERRVTNLNTMVSTDFLVARAFQQASAASVRAAEDAVVIAMEQAEDRRIMWAEEAKKVNALERLDERRRAEHRLEMDREEAAEIDDIVVSRHGRFA